MRAILIALAAATTLSGCVTSQPVDLPVAAATRDWRAVATGGDRSRLRDWRKSFTSALTRARTAGHGAEIDAEGPLLMPDAALGGGPVPNGDCLLYTSDAADERSSV